MPIPKPKTGEKEKEFISRCMEFQSDEKDLTDEKTRKQALAICYTSWENANESTESTKTFKEILEEKVN